MKKDIYINDSVYSLAEEVFFKLESVQQEMQELVNQNQFKSECYNSLRKLFSTFLRHEIKRNKVMTENIKSDFYYYTR
ncbi:MAG: hypothetical protein HRT69_17515 [Flavobacteriaceae bacterium]|nr:hypothetical protein [Flavobacteriaceae bacterium]